MLVQQRAAQDENSATLSAVIECAVKSGACKSIRVFVGPDCRVTAFEAIRLISDVAQRFWRNAIVTVAIGPMQSNGTMAVDISPKFT